MENKLRRILLMAVPVSLLILTGCGDAKPPQPQTERPEMLRSLSAQPESEYSEKQAEPLELEEIPAAYLEPAAQQGTLERLEYSTWDSFTYEDHAQSLTKTAWVYLPYGYTEEKEYNIFYLSHGGWSNETTLLGTDTGSHEFKHIVDHAIEDGKIQPLILVALTYNNLNSDDAWDYGRSLQLTNNFHRELVNDLIPAVEGKYSTYAADTTAEGLMASRDHRGFGGFSMGSVNTWHTFEYCLDYFRYFMPSSGSLTTVCSFSGEAFLERTNTTDPRR